jgi:hypothetical protein
LLGDAASSPHELAPVPGKKLVRKNMMLSCKETIRLLSQGADRKLGFGERVALRVHLAICDGCRNVNAQFKFLRLAVKSLTQDGHEEKSA